MLWRRTLAEVMTVLAVIVAVPVITLATSNLLRSRSSPSEEPFRYVESSPIRPLVDPIFLAESHETAAIDELLDVSVSAFAPLDGPVAIHILRLQGSLAPGDTAATKAIMESLTGVAPTSGTHVLCLNPPQAA